MSDSLILDVLRGKCEAARKSCKKCHAKGNMKSYKEWQAEYKYLSKLIEELELL